MLWDMNYCDATCHVLRLAFELTYLFGGEMGQFQSVVREAWPARKMRVGSRECSSRMVVL